MGRNFCSGFSDSYIENVFLPVCKKMGFPFENLKQIRESTNVELESVFMQFGCSSDILVKFRKVYKSYKKVEDANVLSNRYISSIMKQFIKDQSLEQNTIRTEYYLSAPSQTPFPIKRATRQSKSNPIYYCSWDVSENGNVFEEASK